MKTKSVKASWTAEAKAFFRQITSEYELAEDEITLLTATCQNLSTFWQANKQLEAEGLTITTEAGMIRKHPCIEIIKNAWAAVLSGCRLLQIGVPAETKNRPGRPTGGYKGANQ